MGQAQPLELLHTRALLETVWVDSFEGEEAQGEIAEQWPYCFYSG
jgi:hypothetical protein